MPLKSNSLNVTIDYGTGLASKSHASLFEPKMTQFTDEYMRHLAPTSKASLIYNFPIHATQLVSFTSHFIICLCNNVNSYKDFFQNRVAIKGRV